MVIEEHLENDFLSGQASQGISQLIRESWTGLHKGYSSKVYHPGGDGILKKI